MCPYRLRNRASTPHNMPLPPEINMPLPPEIIEEILCSLPVKSLNRFRCVAKSWNSLISESRFIRKHIRYASRPGSLQVKTLIMSECRSDFTLLLSPLFDAFCCPLSSVQPNLPIKDATDINPPFKGAPVTLRAYCDGLWCVASGLKSYILWNPIMRAYKELPDPPAPQEDLISMVHGIGYDAASDDYKILRVLFSPIRGECIGSTLYSLKNNSWTDTERFPWGKLVGYYRFNCNGVFVEGAIHWIVVGLDQPRVFSFILSTGRYKALDLPDLVSTGIYVQVTVLREKLCVLFVNHTKKSVVLWRMNEYGVSESWAKLFDISYSCGLPIPIEVFAARPSSYSYDDNEFLVSLSFGGYEKEVFGIIKDGKIVSDKVVVAGGRGKIRDAFVQVESLVSPLMFSAPKVAGIKRCINGLKNMIMKH